MDDSSKTQTNVGQPTVDLQSISPMPATNTSPTPLPSAPKLKEQGPMTVSENTKPVEPDWGAADKVAKEEGDEYWENYAREIELEKEILEMGGVEKVESGEVTVPEELAKEMGVRPTVGPQTPIDGVTDFSIRGVFLSDDQLTAGVAKPTSTGWRWLVEWFIYHLRKAHYFIKKVNGKIFRFKAEK